MWEGFAGAALSGLAQLGGGLFSAQGAAQQNQLSMQFAQNMQQQQNAWQAHQAFLQREAASRGQAVGNEFASDMAAAGREFSNWQADKAMGFSERMANTAYQRAMADMKSAGLNPILAYQQGGGPAPQGTAGSASTASATGASPGGASGSAPSASFVNENDALGRAMGNAVSSAVDTAKTLQGVDLMKSQEALTKQKEAESKAVQQNVDQDTKRKVEETRRTAGEADNTQATGDLIRAQTHSAGARAAVDSNAARVYGKYDSPAAPTFMERMGRIIQDAVESGRVPPTVQQYIPTPTQPGGSDFWGTSPRVQERARQNRERYSK